MSAHYAADLARFNTVIEKAGALRIEPDGFQWIDETRLPAGFGETYGRFISHGYATGELA